MNILEKILRFGSSSKHGDRDERLVSESGDRGDRRDRSKNKSGSERR